MIIINRFRLREWMLDRLWKTKDLAIVLGYSEAYIGMLFRGSRQPGREFMERLVSVTNLPLDTLFIVKRKKELK